MNVVRLNLQVNGEARMVDGPISVAALLAGLGHEPAAVAVAVNEVFVPRAERAQRVLVDGDRVTCFQPIVGG